jgi:alpha-L-rhamnosidase
MMARWLAVVLLAGTLAQAAPRVSDLRTEYDAQPLGLGTRTPRFSWRLESDRRGTRQRAYQILVSSSPAAFDKANFGEQTGDLWDSGMVAAATSQFVPYAGRPLTSRQRVYWKVRVWDDAGDTADSAPSWFETALLSPDEWSVPWVGGSGAASAGAFSGAHWIWRNEPPPSATTRYFRRVVTLPPDALVRRAVAHIAVDDHFTLYVNGQEMAKDDGGTDAWRRPVSVDVAAQLHAGSNVLAIKAFNVDGPAGVLCRVEIAGDHVSQAVFSDTEWRVAPDAPTSWLQATFDDAAWEKAHDLGPVGVEPWGNLDAAAAGVAAPYLRLPFTVAKPVTRARLYITALGLYEAHLNGAKVGTAVLAPDWTDYHRRVQFQTYDVTGRIKLGDNVLGAVLGDGWYCGHVGLGGRNRYGTHPMLRSQLMLDYADGTHDLLGREGWKTASGPILKDDLLDGETYDARKEIPGWDQPGFDDAAWHAAAIETPAAGALEPSQGPRVEVLDELPAKELTEPKPGRYTFDLGQNMVGVARLKAKAAAGTTVTLRFAEMLNPDGTIYTTNYRGARCTDTYTFRSDGEETYQPTFTFRGFRYCEVTGLPAKPALDAVRGVVIGSAIPRSGTLQCSEPRLNQLIHNIFWGQRGNFLSVPTDCPQRDERLGWMGDAQIFCRTATFNNDVDGFFAKWLVDVDDAQAPDGAFPDVAPGVAGGGGTAAWGDAGVVCPWTMWLAYGDRRILEDHYPAMVKWVEYCRKHSTNLLRPNNGYGDWLAIGSNTPRDVLATAYFALSTKLTAQTAAVLGKTEEAQKLEALFGDIKGAFQKAYVSADGHVKGNSQTCYLLALRFGLLPDELRAPAADLLVKDIEKRGWRLSTGFVGVGHLLPTLTSIGRSDVAWKLLLQDSFPSWLFSVKHGATTIWERWDGWTPERGFQDAGMNSFNHYSYGSCGEWMEENIGGLAPDVADPAYHHVFVHPRPCPEVTWAKAGYLSGYGPFETAWKVDAGVFSLDLTVPGNVSATVTLPVSDASRVTESGQPITAAGNSPDGPLYEVGSGVYHFSGPAR